MHIQLSDTANSGKIQTSSESKCHRAKRVAAVPKTPTNICTRLNRSELISSAIGRIRFFGVLPRRLSRPLGFYETDTHPVDSARNAVVEAHEFGVQHQTRLVDYRHRTRSIDVGRVPLRPTIDNRVKSVLETRGQWRNRRQKSSLVHRCCTDEPYK